MNLRRVLQNLPLEYTPEVKIALELCHKRGVFLAIREEIGRAGLEMFEQYKEDRTDDQDLKILRDMAAQRFMLMQLHEAAAEIVRDEKEGTKS